MRPTLTKDKTMATKKQFQPLMNFLGSNKTKTVEEIMGAVLVMCESKRVQDTVIYDPDNGKALAIFCYYHKQWELISDYEYGVKKSTTSGLNTMCKVGASHWNKQWKESTRKEKEMLSDVMSGKIQVEQMVGIQRQIERGKFTIIPTEFRGPSDMEGIMKLIKVRL